MPWRRSSPPIPCHPATGGGCTAGGSGARNRLYGLRPSAHAQTKFALTRQADLWSAESGEREGTRAAGVGRVR
ncbi:hypothetical protein GAY31_22420, partial [Azospirillum brasilense]|nr:hypothetical protein [Azospirillum brasilense]